MDDNQINEEAEHAVENEVATIFDVGQHWSSGEKAGPKSTDENQSNEEAWPLTDINEEAERAEENEASTDSVDRSPSSVEEDGPPTDSVDGSPSSTEEAGPSTDEDQSNGEAWPSKDENQSHEEAEKGDGAPKVIAVKQSHNSVTEVVLSKEDRRKRNERYFAYIKNLLSQESLLSLNKYFGMKGQGFGLIVEDDLEIEKAVVATHNFSNEEAFSFVGQHLVKEELRQVHEELLQKTFSLRQASNKSDLVSEVLSHCDSLFEEARLAGCADPDLTTSTRLRKYIATVCQVSDLSGQEREWLVHDLNTHTNFYRLQGSVTELAKFSRLLLAAEEGKATKFKNKNLDAIDLRGNKRVPVNGKSKRRVVLDHAENGSVQAAEVPAGAIEVPIGATEVPVGATKSQKQQ